MPIEVNTDSNNDIVIEVEAGQGNANVTIDSQSQIISAIGTTALYGPKGDKGDQGDPGENATIEIGTVATGDPGTSVIVENAGTDTNAVLNFTIPRGDTGETGADGQDGADGVGISSIEKTSSSGLVDTYTITYTDTNTDTFDVTNGADGQDGQNGADGQDGYSPTATVSKSGTVSTITITDKNGTTTAQVLDGAGGVADVEVNGSSVVSSGVASITISNAGISGSYNDLTNKPTIPDAQIQADYNQSDNTKVDYIKNKPDLSTKQDTLVSGTNIKTINNESVLGSGNLETLNNNQVSNCILEAPNGIYEISGRILTIKGGVKVLIPDGRNSDNTLKNIEYTLQNDVSIDYSIYSAGGLILVFLTSDGTGTPVTMSCLLGAYKYVTQLPSTVGTTATYYAYCDYNNYWYKTSGSTTTNWQTVSVVPITPLYFATSTTMNGSSLYSLPVKIADSNMVDGKWTPKYSLIANGVSWGSTAKTYSLFDYLPRDNFNYEVLIGSSITTGSTSGNYVSIMINNDLLGDATSAGYAITRSSASGVDACTIILPISTDRSFVVGASTGSSSAVGTYSLRAVAYRRIGNNG